MDAVQLVNDGLPSGAGVNQVVRGVRIRNGQDGLGGGQHPLLFHLLHAGLGAQHVLGGVAGQPGLFDEVKIITGTGVIRVELQGLSEFGFGLVEFAHLIKKLAVLHENARIRFLRDGRRNLFDGFRIRHVGFHGHQHLIVLFFEGDRRVVLRIRL